MIITITRCLAYVAMTCRREWRIMPELLTIEPVVRRRDVNSDCNTVDE